MFNTVDKIYIGLFLVVLGAFFLNACGKKYPAISTKPPLTTVIQDPVAVFCGADCSGCGFSVEKCLSLVKGNLPTLCQHNNQHSKKENCYMVWLKYAKTCRSLCTTSGKASDKALADEKKLTTMTVFEGGHPL
jgi:hypothetical protein